MFSLSRRHSEANTSHQSSAQVSSPLRRGVSNESLRSARSTIHEPDAINSPLEAGRPFNQPRRGPSDESLPSAAPTYHEPDAINNPLELGRPLTRQSAKPETGAPITISMESDHPAVNEEQAAKRALGADGQRSYAEEKDETYVAKGCLQKMTKAAIRTERQLDRVPIPQIKPLSVLRRPGCLHRTCEFNACCYFCARRGVMICGLLRKLLLLPCFFFTLASFLLRIFPPLALNHTVEELAVYEYPWAVGTYNCIAPDICLGVQSNVYIGLASLMVETSSDELTRRKIVLFDSSDCPASLALLGPEPYCEMCQSAAVGSATVCILSIPVVGLCFWVDIQRMSAKNDHNCIKNWGIFLHVVSLLLLLLAVAIFFGLCIYKYPELDAANVYRMQLGIGKGGFLVVFALLTNLVVLICHIIIPVPEARWSYVHRDEDPANDMWPRMEHRRSDVVSMESTSSRDMPVNDSARLSSFHVRTSRSASFGGGKADELHLDDIYVANIATRTPEARVIGSSQKPQLEIAPE